MRKRPSHKKAAALIGFMWALLAMAFIANAQPAAMATTMAPAHRPAAAAMPATTTTMAPAPTTALAPMVTTMEVTTTIDTMGAVQPAMKIEPAQPKKGGKQDTWWQALLGGLLKIFLVLVGALLVALAPFLIKIIARKAKITDQDAIKSMEELYEKAITLGVNFATQQSNKLDNNPDAKAKRIKWATDKVLELLKEWNLPEKGAKWVADRIEAKLGEKGKKPPKPEQAEAEKPAPEKEKPKEEETKPKPEGDSND